MNGSKQEQTNESISKITNSLINCEYTFYNLQEHNVDATYMWNCRYSLTIECFTHVYTTLLIEFITESKNLTKILKIETKYVSDLAARNFNLKIDLIIECDVRLVCSVRQNIPY